MNFLATVNSVVIKSRQRIIKALLSGQRNVQEADSASLPGIDSSPIKDMVAIYGETQVRGEEVIIGYINPNELAEPGEIRLFAQDDNGNQKCYTWLKKDGSIELDGDQDNAVRFSKLAEAYNELNDKFNAHITAYNLHVHSGVTTGAGSSGPTPSQSQTSTGNIAPAKIENIKTS